MAHGDDITLFIAFKGIIYIFDVFYFCIVWKHTVNIV